MGDTPSLLYMMDGNPDDPEKESCWGGSFRRTAYTSRRVFERATTLNDTVPVYSVIELRMKDLNSTLIRILYASSQLSTARHGPDIIWATGFMP